MEVLSMEEQVVSAKTKIKGVAIKVGLSLETGHGKKKTMIKKDNKYKSMLILYDFVYNFLTKPC